MARQDLRRFLLCTAQLAALGLSLAACEAGSGGDTAALTADGQPIVDATVGAPTTVKLIDRDVEAPDVFSASGDALWDGRPSLGGVWVATPDAKDPQRVIMRNPANGKFVIGALFRREAANPGPKLQISSDAADALGILAGSPSAITVTALRREEAAVPQPDAAAPLLASAETVGAETVGAETIAADAAKAIDGKAAAAAATPTPTATAAPATPAAATTATAAKPAAPDAAAAAAPAPAKGGFFAGLTAAFKNPSKTPAAETPAETPAAAPATDAITTAPLTAVETAAPAPAAPPPAPPAQSPPSASIKVGTFSVEANAQRAVDILKKVGIASTIHTGEAQGKKYWYVTVSGDSATLAKVRAAGFADAYLVRK